MVDIAELPTLRLLRIFGCGSPVPPDATLPGVTVSGASPGQNPHRVHETAVLTSPIQESHKQRVSSHPGARALVARLIAS
jgi:hypothetical protein